MWFKSCGRSVFVLLVTLVASMLYVYCFFLLVCLFLFVCFVFVGCLVFLVMMSLCFVQVFEMLNFLAENFIFVYMGVTLFTFQHHEWHWGFICFSFVCVIVFCLIVMLNV